MEFDKWILNAIRYDETIMSWMEERRYEWIPLAYAALEKLIGGSTVIVVTDKEREWFGKYIAYNINKPLKNRPLIPCFLLQDIMPYLNEIKKDEDVELLYDMLSISFKDDYFFWYIGRSNDSKAIIAKRKEDSFLWVMDEEIQNSFYLKSFDELLDLKLFQLFRLFDKSLDAVLFGEIEIEK
jgi:hypothetical protein